MKHTHTKGFTLVELLIVIAILGIILGLTAPSFIRARDRARVAEVTSQLVADLAQARSSSRKDNLDASIFWANSSNYTLTYNGQTFTRTFPDTVTITMPNVSNITYNAPLGERSIISDVVFRVARTGQNDIYEDVAVLGVTGKVYRKSANN